MLDRFLRAIRPPDAGADPVGGLPFVALYPSGPGAVGIRPRLPGSRRAFAGSGSSQLIAPANAARTELTIYNGAGVDLYVVHGPLAAPTLYTALIVAGGTYILEEPDCYQGDVAALWSSGGIQVTEQSRGE